MRNRDPARLPPLDLLAAFEAAARHLSFTQAAVERFVTQSAISRQIRQLEDDLGAPLFERRHRALALTDEGRRLFATCSSALEAIRSTATAIRAPRRREVLALTTTPGVAALWLIPRLPLFTREFPGIDVRIDTGLEARDLRQDGFDIAIRYLPADATVGQPLFSESLLPVCSPGLIERGPALRRPADLAAHTLIQLASPPQSGMPVEWLPWLQALGVPDLQPSSTLTFNGYGEAIAAAVAGQGVALGRRPLIDDLLRQRSLVAPFRQSLVSARRYVLLVAPQAAARPAVAALAAWLLAQATGPGPGKLIR